MKYIPACLSLALMWHVLCPPARAFAGTEPFHSQTDEAESLENALTSKRIIFALIDLREQEIKAYRDAELDGLSGKQLSERSRQLAKENPYPPNFYSIFRSEREVLVFEDRITRELSNFIDRYAKHPEDSTVSVSANSIVALYLTVISNDGQRLFSDKTMDKLRTGISAILKPKSKTQLCDEKLKP